MNSLPKKKAENYFMILALIEENLKEYKSYKNELLTVRSSLDLYNTDSQIIEEVKRVNAEKNNAAGVEVESSDNSSDDSVPNTMSTFAG